MPGPTTPQEKEDWERATKLASAQGREEDWRHINAVFQKIKRGRKKREKKAGLMKKVASIQNPSSKTPVIRRRFDAHEFDVVED